MSGKKGKSASVFKTLTDKTTDLTPPGLRRGYLTGNRQLDTCSCECHRHSGIQHCVPCCTPASQDPFDIQREQDTPLFQPERG